MRVWRTNHAVLRLFSPQVLVQHAKQHHGVHVDGLPRGTRLEKEGVHRTDGDKTGTSLRTALAGARARRWLAGARARRGQGRAWGRTGGAGAALSGKTTSGGEVPRHDIW